MGGYLAYWSGLVKADAYTVGACAVLLISHIFTVHVVGVRAPLFTVDGIGSVVIADVRPSVEVSGFIHLVPSDIIAACHGP